MSSNLTPKNLFGNQPSPTQVNHTSTSPNDHHQHAVVVSQSQTDTPMNQLIRRLEAESPLVGVRAVEHLNNCYADDGMVSQVPDIFTVAMKALIALNLPVTRYRKKIRAEREQKFKKRLLDQIKSSHRQSGKNPIVEEAFAGLRLRKRSNT